MEMEVKIPSVGESIKEGTMAEWLKPDGETVAKDEPLFTIETDKVSLEVVAPVGGILHIRVQVGDTVPIGTVAAVIEEMAEEKASEPKEEETPILPTAVRNDEIPDRPTEEENRVERKPMSPIRKRIAEHLVAAKQNTAMLTTFN
ncbi:MAG: biotin/lipoyl-containing protein, partial [bacterium]